MRDQSYELARRGMRLCLLVFPLILIVPIMVFLFPQMDGSTQEWLSKSGIVLIWTGVGFGAAGFLMFLFNRGAVLPEKRLEFLVDTKPFLWLNLLIIGGFLGLYLVRLQAV